MKKILLITFLVSFAFNNFSQESLKLDDVGRIVLNSYVPEELGLPSQAHNLLENKLNQISTFYGMGGSSIDQRFVLMAVVNILSKDIIAGPPQLVALGFEVSLYVGDAIDNRLFSNGSVNLKGVGNNPNEALINGIKNISQKNQTIASLVQEGKNKIVEYYESNCDFIVIKARALEAQEKYDEAIFTLLTVPEVCKECYIKCMDAAGPIYQKKIDVDGLGKFNEARNLWAVAQNKTNAFKIADILSTINPNASCITQVDNLVKNINAKLRAAERQEWEWKMKVYNDNLEAQKFTRESEAEIRKSKIEAYRQIGLEQDKHVRRIKNRSLFGLNLGSGIGALFL
ncbi:MAG TPA: hypothetical protein PLV06_06180 [Bacteroidales bacterium]|nr:hypothetical protein [Bacteroidales bacterium]